MTNKYEKLIILLNRYREKEHGYNVPEWEEKELSLPDCYIISKELGFIKWLVDNDKIDLGKLIMIKDEEQKAIVDIDNSRENTLLMLLAIQDEPIEFLIAILK